MCLFAEKKVGKKLSTHGEVNNRGCYNGLEATKVGISDKASEQREDGGDADPGVYIFGGGGGVLTEDIGEVGEEVSGHPVVSKPLCHFNNYSTPRS